MEVKIVHRRIKARVCSAVLAVLVLSQPVASWALKADDQSLAEGAKLCTQYLPRHERQYGIPEHLLAAIASTESGRFHRGLGLNLPWPWTINVNGRGYFFDTKDEAVAAVNKLRSQGYQSIDVGCMQVNLRHHPKAFASVEQAFDPAYNIGYAAGFLKRNFSEEGSWKKATGDYHSRTASYGMSYANQVFGTWGRIVTKVADARAGRPVINVAASAAPKMGGQNFASASRVVRPSYRSVHMHMIKVASREKAASRENGVLVIRPQKNDDIIVASVNNDPGLVVKASSVKVASSPALMNPPDQPVKRAATGAMKVVDVATGKVSTKGQFTPRARSVTTAPDAAPAAKAGSNMFVFDN